MANDVWPSTLPQKPLVDGYGEDFPENTIRTEMEVGPAKLRRRSTAAPKKITISFLMTQIQVATFETFFNTTLSSGSLPFDWAHPRTGVTESFRFMKPPQIRPASGLLWKVALELEELP
jgi:hypothetical protein